MTHTAGLYKAAEVAELDRALAQRDGVPTYTLMQRAGAAARRVLKAVRPEARRVLVVAGAGNNAGDGWELARLLQDDGLDCRVLALRTPQQLGGDAATAARAWVEAGGDWREWDGPALPYADVYIDALLGTGLDGELRAPFDGAVAALNAAPGPVLALDLPSGLHADTGAAASVAVQARWTVTFVARKRGQFTARGPDLCGALVLDDLGRGDSASADDALRPALLDAGSLRRWLPPRRPDTHKGSFGHVLVAGGAPGMSGAALLAGSAALRGGAGLVSLATHPEHAALLTMARPELMVRGVADGADREQPALGRGGVVVLGTGLDTREWGRSLWARLVTDERPLVLDADGLNLLAEQPRPRVDWILTPHPGEAARLLGTDTAAVQADRFGAAAAMAARFGAVVVLKGAGTIVAAPQGQAALCPYGNPGLATGGSGDVLAGLCGAMLAQGLDPWTAARAAVVAHARAGDRAAAQHGERAMIAGDLLEQL